MVSEWCQEQVLMLSAFYASAVLPARLKRATVFSAYPLCPSWDRSSPHLARNSKASASGALFVAFVPPGANDFNLHMGEQRRQRPQSGQHWGHQRYHATHRHSSRKRHLQEHLVVLIADDETANVALLDELLGPSDQL